MLLVVNPRTDFKRRQPASVIARSCAACSFSRYAVVIAATVAFAISAANARPSVRQFYKGKTINFYIGYSPGGGYDAYARIVAKHLGNHIPGAPTIIPHNMAGASSRIAAAYVYSIAPKDGTTLGTADQSLALAKVLGDRSISFDPRRFNWIGNPDADNNVTITWYKSGVGSLAAAKLKDVPMGVTGGSTSSQYPMAMNYFLGTKFKIITGYPGGSEINLAMQRGELAGRGSVSWAALKSTHSQWIHDRKVNVLVQIGLRKARDLPSAPLLMDLVSDPLTHAALKLLSAPTRIGRPIIMPPGTPPERVAALRKAFDATMKDPAFIRDIRRARLELNPVTGQELQKIVANIDGAPKTVTERLAKALGDRK